MSPNGVDHGANNVRTIEWLSNLDRDVRLEFLTRADMETLVRALHLQPGAVTAAFVKELPTRLAGLILDEIHMTVRPSEAECLEALARVTHIVNTMISDGVMPALPPGQDETHT